MQAWWAEENSLKNIKNLTVQKRLTGSVGSWLVCETQPFKSWGELYSPPVLVCSFVFCSDVKLFGVLRETVFTVNKAKTIDLFPFKPFSLFLSALRCPLNNAGLVFYLHFTVTFAVECECAVGPFLCRVCEWSDTCPALGERYRKKWEKREFK